jgi:hypothetical protein
MLRQRRSPHHLIVAAALVAVSACGDHRGPSSPLVPSDSPSAIAGGASKVKLKTLQLSANTLRIDGPGETAALTIGNSGQAIQSGISVRAEVVQGAASRLALDVPTQCLPGDPPGFLSTGECAMSVPFTVSNSTTGSGTLVPGAAVFVMHVLQTSSGTVELATKSVNVTLVSSPSITSLTLVSTTLAIGGPSTGWTATMQNPAKSLQNMVLQGAIVQGPAIRTTGALQVSCGSAPGVLPPGTCTISSSAGAANSNAGLGTLVPGPAQFQLSLIQGQTTIDMKSVAVTLVSSTPSISSLVLDATSIVIGSGVEYTVQLQNPGFPQSDIILQGEMVQETENGTVVKGAGGFSIDCGSGLGILPTIATGSCSLRFGATALADAIGGAFVPGLAHFVLHLYSAPVNTTPVEYDSKTVEVTLLPNTPTFTSVVPASSYVVLGSGFTGYKAVINNPGGPVTGATLQGWISQGGARRAAGGTQSSCKDAPSGVLPTGSCITLGDIVASNALSGVGTLVLGPATFELELAINGTIVDTKSAPITLVPTTPSIVSLDLESSSIQIGGSTHFNATVFNPGSSNLTSALVQGSITQGSVESPAGGVVLVCPSTGVVAPGACNVRFTVNPSNQDGLVVGAAQYVLKFYVGGVVQDTRSVPITLTGP